MLQTTWDLTLMRRRPSRQKDRAWRSECDDNGWSRHLAFLVYRYKRAQFSRTFLRMSILSPAWGLPVFVSCIHSFSRQISSSVRPGFPLQHDGDRCHGSVYRCLFGGVNLRLRLRGAFGVPPSAIDSHRRQPLFFNTPILDCPKFLASIT